MTNRRPIDTHRAAGARTRQSDRSPSRSGTRSSPPLGGKHAQRRREAERRATRRRRALIAGGSVIGAGAVLVLILTVAGTSTSPPPSATAAVPTGVLGPEGIPLEAGTPLTPASSPATGQTVDGIRCDASEQVAYHVHTHLSIYVNGQLRPLPAGVGIVEPEAQLTSTGAFYGASHCYYWLHVHAQDGVIHIESPTSASYTLGQFFDIWGQPLQAGQVGPATGTLTVFVDGRRFGGDPRTIALGSHVDIQIDVGTPAPPAKAVDWSRSEL